MKIGLPGWGRSWFNADEIETGVEFTVTRAGDSYAVRVCDRFDGEAADVFETAWDGERLSFAAHWNSTGRFARYRLLLLSASRIDVTYLLLTATGFPVP